jgi:hypothetical protein
MKLLDTTAFLFEPEDYDGPWTAAAASQRYSERNGTQLPHEPLKYIYTEEGIAFHVLRHNRELEALLPHLPRGLRVIYQEGEGPLWPMLLVEPPRAAPNSHFQPDNFWLPLKASEATDLYTAHHRPLLSKTTTPLQQFTVTDSKYKGWTLERVLVNLPQEDLKTVGQESAIPHLLRTLTDRETELLERLAKIRHQKGLWARIWRLESDARRLRDSVSFNKDDDPSKWPTEILECAALEERVTTLHAKQERIKELRLLLKTV